MFANTNAYSGLAVDDMQKAREFYGETILNFQVGDIDTAVDQLTARGVRFERYDGVEQDTKGIPWRRLPTRASGVPALEAERRS